jgi:hypothetical protein
MARKAFTLITHRGVVLKINIPGLSVTQVERNGNVIVLVVTYNNNAKLND